MDEKPREGEVYAGGGWRSALDEAIVGERASFVPG